MGCSGFGSSHRPTMGRNSTPTRPGTAGQDKALRLLSRPVPVPANVGRDTLGQLSRFVPVCPGTENVRILRFSPSPTLPAIGLEWSVGWRKQPAPPIQTTAISNH
jgi:hypothetical protein